MFELFLCALELGELAVETLLEGVGHESVLGVAQVKLLESAVSLVPGGFDLQPGALDLVRGSLLFHLGGGDRGLDSEGFEGSVEFPAYTLIDARGAEGKTTFGALLVSAVTVIEGMSEFVADLDLAAAVAAAKDSSQ